MTGRIQEKKGYYYAILNFKDSDGKYKKKWIATGLPLKGNKRKAEQILNELLLEHGDSTYIEPSKMLFCEFVKEWVEMSKQKVQITTYDGYVHMLNKHIYPYFKEKNIKLTKLTPMDLQRYYFEKSQSLSANTVHKHHGVIRTALELAVKSKLIKENVADLADKPKRERFIGSFYTIEELNRLFEVSKGTLLETPILLAAFYGLRRSEVLGLKWSAIDFQKRNLNVSSKVIRGINGSGTRTAIEQSKLKSETSYRTLPLCNAVYDYLEELKQKQINYSTLMGNKYNHEYDDFVCVTPMGDLIKPDYVTGAFCKLLKKHELRRIRYHDLRHSCASLLVFLGFNLKEIQEWLGHSDFLITANTYSHVDMKEKITMINTLSEKLVM